MIYLSLIMRLTTAVIRLTWKRVNEEFSLFMQSLGNGNKITKTLAMNFTVLDQNQQRYILDQIAGNSAYNGSIWQRIASVKTLTEFEKQKLTVELTEQLLTKELTTDQINAALAAWGLVDAEHAQVVAAHGAQSATMGFAAELKTMWSTNPAGLILMVASVVATVLIPVLSAAIKTTKELREEYENEQSDLASLQDEYDHLSEKIQKLNDLKAQGDFSEERQKELDDLIEQNEQLKRQLDYKTAIAELDREKLQPKIQSDFVNALYTTEKVSPAANTNYTMFNSEQMLREGWLRVAELNAEIEELETKAWSDPKKYGKQIEVVKQLRRDVINDVDAVVKAFEKDKAYLDEDTLDLFQPLIDSWQDLTNSTILSTGNVSSTVDRLEDTADGIQTITQRLKELDVEITAIYSKGGNVDLINRPNVKVTDKNLATVHGWGMQAQVGDTMTVASQTFRDANAALVVTPILPDGSLLTQEDLEKYIDAIILKANQDDSHDYAKYDDKGILMGVFGDEATWEDNLALSDEFAQKVHEIHEALLHVLTPEEAERLRAAMTDLTGGDNGLKQLDTLRDDISALSAAFKDLSDGNNLGVTYKSLSAIREKFSDVKGIDAYISRLASAGANAKEVSKILSELAYQKMLNAANSNALSAADEQVVEAMLREVGVANADKVAFVSLQLAMIQANKTGLNFSGQIKALLELGTAAGVAKSLMDSVFTTVPEVEMNGDGTVDVESVKANARAKQKNNSSNTVDKLVKVIKDNLAMSTAIDFSGAGGGSSGGSTEEYLADIEKYREAIRKLNAVQAEKNKLDHDISRTDSAQKQIFQQRQLIEVYGREQDALHELNDLRRADITTGVQQLRDLGFVVEYNAETNDLWIENLEHLNEIGTGTIEKINEMRHNTEDLIEEITELNEANQEGTQSWYDLDDSIADAHKEINSLLKDIVDAASAAVDEMQNIYNTLHKAADEYAASGYVTIDTVQAILSLGGEYLHYLIDENGQLVINEKSIRAVIKAKTEQLAIDSALTYVEALAIAKSQGRTDELNRLLYATEATAQGTWGLVYATIAYIGLTEEESKAALHVVNAMRALADMSVDSIGSELNNMKNGVDSILKYVQEMLKHEQQINIEALEKQKELFGELLNQQRESLKLKQKENDYNKSVEKKLKDIAKLQAKIDALSLDNSREAQAERAKLLESLAEQQESLSDDQNSHAIEAQEEALDRMQENYEKQKDAEIKAEEEKYSSAQKLYDASIAYISSHWATLYDELNRWNYESGQYLTQEIGTAWENCLAAAKRYGDYVSAHNLIGSDLEAERGKSNVIGNIPDYPITWNAQEEQIAKEAHAYLAHVYKVGADGSAPVGAKEGDYIVTTGGTFRVKADGTGERIDDVLVGNPTINSPEERYQMLDARVEEVKDLVRKHIYHKGGIVGESTLRQDEIFATLQKGELVLTKQQQSIVGAAVDFMAVLKDRLTSALAHSPTPSLFGTVASSALLAAAGNVGAGNVVNFGDVIINGADKDTVAKHREVNREFVNEVIKVLNIHR